MNSSTYTITDEDNNIITKYDAKFTNELKFNTLTNEDGLF